MSDEEAPNRRRSGDPAPPDHALDTGRRPPPIRNPVVASEIDAPELAALLAVPGPVMVIDAEGAREAWDGLRPDVSTHACSATTTSKLVEMLRNPRTPGKLILLDCTEGGLHPETVLGEDMSTVRVGILASPGTELSDAAAARCRVVRVLPSPRHLP